MREPTMWRKHERARVFDKDSAEALVADLNFKRPPNLKAWRVMFCKGCEAFHVTKGEMFVAFEESHA
jgi:hypothetical protein